MRTHESHQIDTASVKLMIDTFTDAVKKIPLLGKEQNEAEYRKALALVEFLVDRDDLENPLFELLSARIRDYEKHAPEFSALNQQLEHTPHGVALLRTLMNQYGLKAADLANELGSKSNVSNILNGRRALTVSHTFKHDARRVIAKHPDLHLNARLAASCQTVQVTAQRAQIGNSGRFPGNWPAVSDMRVGEDYRPPQMTLAQHQPDKPPAR